MKQKKDTKRKLHKNVSRTIFGFAASLVLLLVASVMLFAKYYAGNNDKGVATASSLYFSSNVLKNVENPENVDEYPIIYNTVTWDGNADCELDVQIRNFQSQLLYNDKNLDITYDVNFKLIDTSDGAGYSVKYIENENTVIKEITQDGITISGMKLYGGKANYDEFKVMVKRPDNEIANPNYRSVGIIVTATPKSPSYITNIGKLYGVLYATMMSASYDLTHEFSNVVGDIDSYSGFPYVISYMPGNDNAEHRVKVMWSESLEIDQYNSYYVQAKNDATLSGVEDGKKYIIISLQPYSAISITFFRGNGFAAADKESLEDLVSVQDLDYSNGAVEGSAE